MEEFGVSTLPRPVPISSVKDLLIPAAAVLLACVLSIIWASAAIDRNRLGIARTVSFFAAADRISASSWNICDTCWKAIGHTGGQCYRNRNKIVLSGYENEKK